MAFDLVQIRELAQTKEDENIGFRQFLKSRCKLQPEEIDQRVFETARRVCPIVYEVMEELKRSLGFLRTA